MPSIAQNKRGRIRHGLRSFTQDDCTWLSMQICRWVHHAAKTHVLILARESGQIRACLSLSLLCALFFVPILHTGESEDMHASLARNSFQCVPQIRLKILSVKIDLGLPRNQTIFVASVLAKTQTKGESVSWKGFKISRWRQVAWKTVILAYFFILADALSSWQFFFITIRWMCKLNIKNPRVEGLFIPRLMLRFPHILAVN